MLLKVKLPVLTTFLLAWWVDRREGRGGEGRGGGGGGGGGPYIFLRKSVVTEKE